MRFSNQESLTEGRIGPQLVRLTIPMVFGMFSMVLFNLVDAYFVSKLGIVQLAAIGFTFPVILAVVSLSLGLGIGASSLISRAVGVGDHHQVQELTSDSLLLSFIVVVLFVVMGFFTMNSLFKVLGAGPVVFEYIKSYMNIWYWGIIFVVLPIVGNHAIRAIGDTLTPALIMMIGAVINIVLDPLLIFGIGPFPHLGLRGAALATVFARAFTAVACLLVLYLGKDMLTFKRPSFQRLRESWPRILYVGIPTAFTRIMRPVTFGILTAMVAFYGPEEVAAFGVASRIEFFAVSVVIALASVIIPFVGQNLGIKRFDRVRRVLSYGKSFSLVWGFSVFLALFMFSKQISSIFADDANIIEQISYYLKIVSLGYGSFGILIISGAALNVFGKPFHSALLMLVQMFVICVPLAVLGSYLYGIKGIFTAILVSYVFSGIIAQVVLKRVIGRN